MGANKMSNEKEDAEKGWLPDIEELNLRKSLATQIGKKT
jgi:hypothetical protein